MLRLESKKPSLCDSNPVNRNTISRPLAQLNELAKSCYGPSGRLKQVHNGVGGCICTTSESNALLSKIPFSHSILKLLSSCVLNHTSRFSDCGLFTTIFCCSLIENLLKTNSVPSNCGKIFTHFLNTCLDYLNADYCRCKLKVDFGSSKTLLAILRSVITSKPACMLTIKEADHITAVVLRAFLLTIPDDTEKSTSLGRMIVIPLEGQQLVDSAVFNGLLVELPKCQDHKQFSAVRVPSGYVKVALFGISMAGELSDVGDGTLEVICDVHPEKATLDQLLVMARQLVNDKVGLVMCQKVIHPAFKQYLQGCHVIVIDRIGVALMDPLVQVTGASAIGSFQNCIPSTCYGMLMDVCCLKFGSKQFLHLIPCSGTVSTLVLCSRNETSLNELKMSDVSEPGFQRLLFSATRCRVKSEGKLSEPNAKMDQKRTKACVPHSRTCATADPQAASGIIRRRLHRNSLGIIYQTSEYKCK
ncbi:McKusick-Kaufman/Bardet-Biedl syndromes putative chaperonin-like isoform X2 [Protopterus annectens]|uniref:McKusick-Kaufman/Bardet-Biedl syndromes putative chaperonin-like isoform X2 n=1 Tax=Protopterus annectens TaxID=7888 RepID=UPI001CFB5707|nr:McKusick-Kaufman/Bardet-Biedl syndromes putative chaperonin-like isoform X2 [Protopterus annectens]